MVGKGRPERVFLRLSFQGSTCSTCKDVHKPELKLLSCPSGEEDNNNYFIFAVAA